MEFTKDKLLIQLDPEKNIKKKIKTAEGKEVEIFTGHFVDSVNKENYVSDNVHTTTLDGVVKAIPRGLSAYSKNNNTEVLSYPIELEVNVGDHVYCHHLIVDPDRKLIEDGEECYWFDYLKDLASHFTTSIYCKIVDGKVCMVHDWNLLEIQKTSEISGAGIIMFGKEQEYKGKLAHKSKFLKNVNIGDEVYMDDIDAYKIKVLDKVYYAVQTARIMFYVQDGQIVMLNNWCLLSEFQPEEVLASGLIIPGRKKQDMAVVKYKPQDLEEFDVEDKVFINPRFCKRIKVKNEEYLITNTNFILAKEL